jgi:hypothetical protein
VGLRDKNVPEVHTVILLKISDQILAVLVN